VTTIKLTAVVKFSIEVPFNTDYYPDMTLEEAVAYQKKEDSIIEFINETAYAGITMEDVVSHEVEVVDV
jgi:hypothetical protein